MRTIPLLLIIVEIKTNCNISFIAYPGIDACPAIGTLLPYAT